MRNDNSDMEYKIDVESDSEVNVGGEVNGENVNMSDVVTVSGEFSMGHSDTPWWKLFHEFNGLDTT